jgi:hypothetical protein
MRSRDQFGLATPGENNRKLSGPFFAKICSKYREFCNIEKCFRLLVGRPF